MGRLFALIALAAVAAFLYWAAESGVIEEQLRGKEPKREQFTLDSVRIKIYDDGGRHYMTVLGDQAIVKKDFKTVRVEKVKVVDDRTVPPGILTAEIGFRKVLRKVEQLEFQRNVYLRQGPEKTLKTQQMFFYPKENIVEVPVHSTTTTTDTTVTGDVLQTSTTLRTGTIRGNVQVVRRMKSATGEILPVTIKGDICPFDIGTGIYTMTGNVVVVRQGLKLTCHETQYRTANERAWARGMVAVTDPEVILTCDELEYDVKGDIVYISATPTSQTTPSASRTSFRVPNDPTTWQLMELHAKKMTYERNKGSLKANKEVLVVRYSLEGSELKKDFEIRSDDLHSVYQGDAKVKRKGAGRSNFTGNVRIESEKVGALGDRAVFYEDSRNFYVIGRAKAWSFDKHGRPINEISGGKILHDGKRGRNIVLEGVRGSFEEEDKG